MMTDEQRLHMITEQLLIVRDNLFRGMSKSMQRLQAKSINEVLELPNFTESPQRTAAEGEDTQKAWVGLTPDEIRGISLASEESLFSAIMFTHDKLKEKNT